MRGATTLAARFTKRTGEALAGSGEAPEYGPCMAALANDKQREFVTQYILLGNATEACRLAGYGSATTDRKGFARLAWQLMHLDAVRAAIAEEARRWLRAGAPAAVRVYLDIVGNPKSKDADRLRAADAITARTDPVIFGQQIEVRHDHHHQHTLTADQVTRRILELSSKLGVAVPPTIEATAVEVSP